MRYFFLIIFFFSKRVLQITKWCGGYFEGGAFFWPDLWCLRHCKKICLNLSLWLEKQEKDKRGFPQEEEDDDGNSEEFFVLWTSESCFTYVITPPPPLPYFQIYIVFYFSNSECIPNQPNQCWWQAWTESRNMCGGKENLDSGFFHLFLNRGIIVQVARQAWHRSLWLNSNTARLCRNLIHQSNAALDL